MRLRKETLSSFALDISAGGIRERVVEQDGKHVQATMTFNEMDFVEHYTPRDRESLVFHSFDGRMIEMPMWSIHEQVPNVLNHVQQHGIKIEQNP